jgi:hypothetical protein
MQTNFMCSKLFSKNVKRVLSTTALCVAGVVGLPQLASAAVCPTTSNTNTDCGYILNIGVGDVITGSLVAGANPYDGSDDALVGIVNNSGASFTGSFTLSGSGNGGGIFGFDGDGICSYVSASYCSTAATGYEGPLVTFSGISGDQSTGTVNVAGLAAGASTYFSLEGSPASIAAGGGVGVPPVAAVPEPETWALMGLGLGLIGFFARQRRAS